MKGVQFVIDDSGKKKAVLIDLGELENSGKTFMTFWFLNHGNMNRKWIAKS